MLKRARLALVAFFIGSPVFSETIQNHVVPAGGEVSSLSFQILTVGEAVVGTTAGPILGFGFSYVISAFLVPLQVTTDLNPNTLNLKSQGKFVTVSFEVTGAKTTEDIIPQSLRITRVNDQTITPISAEPAPISLADQNGDGTFELIVKFDRQAFIAVLPIGEQVKITLEGSFKDQSPFKVDGFIRTIQPGAIPAHGGGFVFHPSGARMEVGADVLPADKDLHIVKLSAISQKVQSAMQKACESKDLKLVGTPYEFGPEGTNFSAPVILGIPYNPADLPNGISENALKVAYWNLNSQSWELLDSQVDTAKKLVNTRTTHFSTYQVLGGFTPSLAFQLGEVYAFPNPARKGTKPTLHIEVGVADRVEIRIYTIAGELAHQVSLIGAPQVVDDGQGSQYAYEYTWDGYIPSGVYLYVVTAEKSGAGTLRKSGKFSVVR